MPREKSPWLTIGRQSRWQCFATTAFTQSGRLRFLRGKMLRLLPATQSLTRTTTDMAFSFFAAAHWAEIKFPFRQQFLASATSPKRIPVMALDKADGFAANISALRSRCACDGGRLATSAHAESRWIRTGQPLALSGLAMALGAAIAPLRVYAPWLTAIWAQQPGPCACFATRLAAIFAFGRTVKVDQRCVFTATKANLTLRDVILRLRHLVSSTTGLRCAAPGQLQLCPALRFPHYSADFSVLL